MLQGEHSAILSTYIKLPIVIKIFVLSNFEWPIYTDFTVICGDYFLQAPACEHAFCASCIQEWLTRQPTCPVDRNPITPNQLKPVPRILRNLLSRLNITCENAGYGCTAVVKLDMLPAHVNECDFNPKKPVHCELGCGLVVAKDELKVRFSCTSDQDFHCFYPYEIILSHIPVPALGKDKK